VKDNGIGITKEITELGQNTFGLLGIQERARFLGGNVDISGKSNIGTTVTLVVPFILKSNIDSENSKK
jgi:signal transduction histidine kinase